MGLTTCRACGLHACQRCWARSVGWCPACGVSMVATPLLRSLPTEQRRDGVAGASPAAAAASTLGGRSGRGRLPAFAAAGAAFVVAATAFAFVSGVPLGPTGGVAGATGTPGAAGLGGLGFGGPTASGPTGRARPAQVRREPLRARRPGPADRRAEATGGTPGTRHRGSGATRAHARARRPCPGPTRPRGPPRGPRRQADARPTPCIATAPNLVGQHRSEARRLWSAAGFTGTVTALDGHGNYLIASQDRTPGASYPCDTGVTIGP